MKLLKNLHFVIGYILWCIVCCSSQNGEYSTTSSSTSNGEIYSSSTQNHSISISSEATSQTELPSTGSTSSQQEYSSMPYTTTSVSTLSGSLIPSDVSNLTEATSNSLPNQVSSRETTILSEIRTTVPEYHPLGTNSAGSVSHSQSSVSIETSSETYQIADAEVNTNVSSNASTFQAFEISSNSIGLSDSQTTTAIPTSTFQPTTVESRITTLEANVSTSSSQSTICVVSTSTAQANLTETATVIETHSEVTNISSDSSNDPVILHSTEVGDTTVHPIIASTTVSSFNISIPEYTQSSDSEVQRSSDAATNESLTAEQEASNVTTLISGMTEKPETATFDQTLKLNITEIIFTPDIFISSSSPRPVSDTSEIIDIEEVAEEIADERQKKYWTKSDIYLVIGIMFVLNVVNLIIVVYCVLHITKKRQRWERPPMKYGSRILYNNSPQVECIRAVSGRDLASDSECKQGENTSESVPVIRIDEGWCVPIQKEGKPKDKTEDTGV